MTALDADSVRDVRDRSLVEAYKPHDVAEDRLVARLETHDFEVIEHGTNDRHSEEVYLGHGPDLQIKRDGEVVAYIEVKSKESPEWFGRCNRRHYEEYCEFAKSVDVPVFIWFALVDMDTDTLQREAFVEVEDADQIGGRVWDVTTESVVFDRGDAYSVGEELTAVNGEDIMQVENDTVLVDGIPSVHGNDVIELNDKHFRSWEYVQTCLNDTSDSTATTSHSKTMNTPRAVEETLARTRDALRARLVDNPKYDVTQIRTDMGRMGPQLTGEESVGVNVKEDGSIRVTVRP